MRKVTLPKAELLQHRRRAGGETINLARITPRAFPRSHQNPPKNQGDTLMVSWEATNEGGETGYAAMGIQNVDLPVGDPLLGESATLEFLPGATHTFMASWPIPANQTPGTYNLNIFVVQLESLAVGAPVIDTLATHAAAIPVSALVDPANIVVAEFSAGVEQPVIT